MQNRNKKNNAVCQNIFLPKSQCNVSVLNLGSVLLVIQNWGQNFLVGNLSGPDYIYVISKYDKYYRQPKGLFIKFNVARRTKFVSKGGEGVGENVILFVTSRQH